LIDGEYEVKKFERPKEEDLITFGSWRLGHYDGNNTNRIVFLCCILFLASCPITIRERDMVVVICWSSKAWGIIFWSHRKVM
jgi:hypothetical protein